VRILLVRHATPVIDPAVPATRWRLGAPGRAAARRLSLPDDGYFVASDEPKAAETLRCAPGDRAVGTDAGFAEVRRDVSWNPDHNRLARAYVDGVTHHGWEPRAEVADRFDRAITRHAVSAAGRPLVVGTHGMAMTCWLAARGLITGEPGEFWAALGFPGVVAVGPLGDTAGGPARLPSSMQAVAVTGRGPM
jgi:broad specificity phosphatase PhoE